MGMLEEQSEGGLYLNITAGKLRQKVDPSDPKAVRREYEVGGTKGEVYERVYNAIVGKITKVYLKHHDEYGDTLVLVIEADGNKASVNINTESRYFGSFVRIAKSLDLNKITRLFPYDFTKDGKRSVGLSVKQTDSLPVTWKEVDKLADNYTDWKDGKPHPKNGMEKFDWSKADTKTKKRVLGLQMTEFLTDEVKSWIASQNFDDRQPTAPDDLDEKDVDELPF